MQSSRQMVGQWFILPENSEFAATDATVKTLEKGYAKVLKDLKFTKTSLPYPEFRTYYKAVLRGAFKPKRYTEKLVREEVKVEDIKLQVWTPGAEKFDSELFKTWKTGKGIDIILSTNGGASKASTTIIIGEPGVGKTTVCADMQYCLQKNYPKAKIACVQAEMKRFDIAYEYSENNMPWMSELQYLILKDYGYANIKNTLIKIFTAGYDILFVDSVENIAKKLQVYADMSHKEAENFILELFEHANDAKNNKNEKGKDIHTTIFAIQQVTKGGEFKGDNALKHETTAMLELRKDDKGNRYSSTSKNRRCGKHVDKRLFYGLNEGNELIYDSQMFEESEVQMDYAKKEKEEIEKRTKNFYDVFSKKSTDKEDKATLTTTDIAKQVFEDVTKDNSEEEKEAE
ncbi:MAG: hypothetical protein ABIP51_15700 [Bacteroidia bacterium]